MRGAFPPSWRNAFLQALMPILGGACGAYFLFRLALHPDGTVWTRGFVGVAVYGLVVLAWLTVLSPTLGAGWRVPRAVRIVAAVTLLAFFLPALSRGLIGGLTILDDTGERFIQWQPNGQTATVDRVRDLANLRQGEDDIRNMVTIEVFHRFAANPFAIRSYYEQGPPGRYGRYLDWHFSHHPPGLPMLFAPFGRDPVLLRLLGFCIYLACIGAVWWSARRAWPESPRTAGAIALIFAAVPDFLVRCALMVSIDLLTAAPVLLAFGFLAWHLRARTLDWAVGDRLLWAAGLALAAGTFVKYSSAYFVGLMALWALFSGVRLQRLILPLALPSVAALLLGFGYSYLAWGRTDFVILQPFLGGGAEPNPEVGVAVRVQTPGAWMIREFAAITHQRIGLPILLLLGAAVLYSLPGARLWTGLQRLCLGLAALLPVFLIFMQVRYLYPAFLIILVAVGLPRLLDHLRETDLRLILATVLGYSYLKFVLQFLFPEYFLTAG